MIAKSNHWSRLPGLLALLAVALVAPVSATSAPDYPFCPPGQTPQFVFGFRALSEVLSDRMGQPLECEHTEAATGDAHQQTSAGLAFYRKVTNTPTFTNGFEHWALTADGLVFWTGESIDPPGVVVPPPSPTSLVVVSPRAMATPAPTATPVVWPEGWKPGPQASGAPRLRGSIDLPAGTAVSQYTPLNVFGWAANLDDPNAPGITGVHVYDGDLAQGRFLAAATLGQRRPDVALALADPRLEAAGFAVEVPAAGLARGTHALTFVVRTRDNGWWQRSAEVVVSAPPARAKGEFIYGTHLANPSGTADLARAAGFTHMWAYVPWKSLEPSRGNFLFKTENEWGQTTPNHLTNVLTAAREAGLKFVLRLDEPPDWAGGKVYLLDPVDVERYVYEVVSYGRGTIDLVEVFNELNLPLEWGTSPPNPAAYVKLLAAAYRGAKALPSNNMLNYRLAARQQCGSRCQ